MGVGGVSSLACGRRRFPKSGSENLQPFVSDSLLNSRKRVAVPPPSCSIAASSGTVPRPYAGASALTCAAFSRQAFWPWPSPSSPPSSAFRWMSPWTRPTGWKARLASAGFPETSAQSSIFSETRAACRRKPTGFKAIQSIGREWNVPVQGMHPPSSTRSAFLLAHSLEIPWRLPFTPIHRTFRPNRRIPPRARRTSAADIPPPLNVRGLRSPRPLLPRLLLPWPERFRISFPPSSPFWLSRLRAAFLEG